MLANFQFQVHVQLAAGKVLLVVDLCVGSPTSLAQYAHAHFHPSTTLLPSRDFPIQVLFPNSTSISFFIPPINTVVYLIERIIQYFILFNDSDKEQKRRACVEATSSGGEGLETEVTSNYIRATPGFNRGCVSNVGKILSARLYCICTKTCTSN